VDGPYPADRALQFIMEQWRQAEYALREADELPPEMPTAVNTEAEFYTVLLRLERYLRDAAARFETAGAALGQTIRTACPVGGTETGDVERNPPDPLTDEASSQATADEVAKLPTAQRNAFTGYWEACIALRKESQDTTDKCCHNWLKEEGKTTTSFGAWSRNLRRAFDALGMSRKGNRPDGGSTRSIVRADQI
jgi:hypothetical protein